VALAFVAASMPHDHQAMDRLQAIRGMEAFASAWLRHKNLGWAAELASTFSMAGERV
jgi:type IV secretion system protein VirB4